MKTKRYFKLSLLLCTAWLSTAGYSQVTIGDEAMPRAGAILDLKKTSDRGYVGGLLLSNVELTSMDSIPIGFTDAGDLGAEKRDINLDLAGLIVYNINEATGTGLYLWDGDKWQHITPCMLDITSASATDFRVTVGQTDAPTLSVSASGSPSLTYQWYKVNSSNQTTLIQSATMASYTVPAADIQNAGIVRYYCKVNSFGCNSVNSPVFTVNVKTNPSTISTGTGSFKGKMCFDIAQTNYTTGSCGTLSSRNVQKTDFATRTQDVGTAPYTGVQVYTFTPSAAVSNVRFDYTETIAGSIDSIVPQDNYATQTGIAANTLCKVTVYYKSTLNNDLKGTDRTTGNKVMLYAIYNPQSDGSGNTEKSVALNISIQDCTCCWAKTKAGGWLNFMCHNLGANDATDPFTPSAAIHGAKYQFGVKDAVLSQAQDQNSTNNNSVYGWPSNSTSGDWASAANPCPAGWRLPRNDEWDDVINTSNNTITRVGTFSTVANDHTNFSAGIKIGDALFLPAAGDRNNNNGSLGFRGFCGSYWSSTADGSYGYYMDFYLNSQYTEDSTHRAYGFSVRCVAE